MNEWIIGNRIPMLNGVDFIDVQLTNDTVRLVQRRPIVDYGSLWFADCTHPAQNAYCSTSLIKAWRISDRKFPTSRN
jgi:hypothetical protein